MASINYAFKEIISKIVYYGPGLSGKTTNLQHVYKKVPSKTRGELISLATDADRTLYFDFLPVNVGTILGFATKFQLYTVPGQVYYNATRKLVLRGVDGVVFVADSQADKMDENIDSLQNLKDNLEEYGYDLNEIPMVIQYNKRDLPNLASIEELEKALNPKGAPFFESVASSGDGVFKTLKAISKMVLEQIRQNSNNTPKIIEPKPAEEESKPAEEESKPAVAEESKAVVAETIMAGTSTAEKQPESKQPESMQPESKPPESKQPESKQPESKQPENKQAESKQEESKQAEIVEQSQTHTNVVVSDMPESSENNDENADDVEETTEKAILKEDSEENAKNSTSTGIHPDVIEDNAVESDSMNRPLYGGSDDKTSFDEEATRLSDLRLKEPLVLGKPQMAESRKVKEKKGLLGLFGGFKKKKK